MKKKKEWEEFVNFVRNPEGEQLRKLMRETLEEGMDNFLFIANSEGPDAIMIRGMHFPDSDILDQNGPTIFETLENNVYLAAYRKSALVEILETIQENLPEKYHEPVWEKAVEKLMAAAEQKIKDGDVRPAY